MQLPRKGPSQLLLAFVSLNAPQYLLTQFTYFYTYSGSLGITPSAFILPLQRHIWS